MNKRIKHYLALAIISIIAVFPTSYLISQPLDSLWMYYYGSDSISENAFDIVQKSDSGYLIVGRKENTFPIYNPYISSIDKEGVLLWENYFNSSGWDAFFDIIATSDGNFLIGGSYNDLAWLVKINEDGDTLWTKNYGNDFGVIRSLQELPNNDVIITGNRVNSIYNFYLLKVDQYGDLIWSHKYIFETPYGISFYNSSQCVRHILDAGYILATGGGTGYGTPFSIIVRTDSNGDTLWKKTYLDDFSLLFTSLYDILVEEDTVYFIGSTYSSNIEGSIVIIKMKSNGEIYWIKGYNDQNSSLTSSYFGAFSNNNTIYVAGSLYNNEQLVYVCEIEKNGDLMWENYYGEFGNAHIALSISNCNNNSIAITGLNHPIEDVFVLKLGDNPSQISTTNNLNNFDYNVFPNPSKSFTNIELYVPNKALTRVAIYSLSGKEIEILENNTLTKGNHSIHWNTAIIPNGIYFCKIEMNNQIHVKKIVVSR